MGLLPLPKDKRDFNLSEVLGVGKYEPKHKKHLLKTKRIHQQKWNTCAWASTTAGKEIDEDCALSTRSLTIAGNKAGYIEGDGFAHLRNVEKTLQKYGIAEQDFCQEAGDTWNWYVNEDYLPEFVQENAISHRSDSYWRIHTLDDALKALDGDRAVKIGIEWDSRWDDLKPPYILNKCESAIFGHALLLIGYDAELELLIVQNSFGEEWGNKGLCYIKFEDFEEMIRIYGAYANLDVSPEKVEELIEYKENKLSLWDKIWNWIVKFINEIL